jgi:hypothetical protein
MAMEFLMLAEIELSLNEYSYGGLRTFMQKYPKFNVKPNLTYLLKPNIFVLFWLVNDGRFGQFLVEVTLTDSILGEKSSWKPHPRSKLKVGWGSSRQKVII